MRRLSFRPEMARLVGSGFKSETRRVRDKGLAIGDRVRLVSSWRTDAGFDRHSPSELPDDAIIVTEFDQGDRVSANGRSRPARWLPERFEDNFPVAEIVSVGSEMLFDINEFAAMREGFESVRKFLCYWDKLNPDIRGENVVVFVYRFRI